MFADYVKRFTDLPFLVTLEERNGALVPGRFLVAADLGDESENAPYKTVLVDAATGRATVPNGSLGFRYGAEGAGRWNLELGEVDPLLTLYSGRAGRPLRLRRGALGRGHPARPSRPFPGSTPPRSARRARAHRTSPDSA